MPVAAINTKSPHRTIIAIAFPAILANSSAPLVGLVDTWAIGHLPDPAYLAAIGLGSVIFNFMLWAFGFLRMGTTGIIAQARGKNNTQLLVAGIWRSMTLAMVLGLVLLLFQDFILLLAFKALAPPDSVTALTTEEDNPVRKAYAHNPPKTRILTGIPARGRCLRRLSRRAGRR